MSIKPTCLIICDGWGESSAIAGNAIKAARTPRLDALQKRWPHTTVAASGEAVGLPIGQQGNSEVGHLTIGSGRTIRQPLSRQNHEIDSGIFYENEILIQAIEIAKERHSAFHIIGLVSPGGVHSHSNGALALARLAKKLELDTVHIHTFTDGRDTDPMSALAHIEDFEKELNDIGTGKIRSVAGRYYAMDRDNRWERIELAYDVLVGESPEYDYTLQQYMQKSYDRNEGDEFIRPVSIATSLDDRVAIQDNDVAVFFNFRPDRARQLSHALVDRDFTAFERKRVITNLHFVSFAEYDRKLGVPVAFPKETISRTLAEVVSDAGLRQYHVAETEKYAHVTYFLNGGYEHPFAGESRDLIPSPRVATYDLQPEMSAHQVTKKVIEQLEKGAHDLIVVNFANADMVGHTGNFAATIEAIEVLDECIDNIVKACLARDGVVVMTADHGNAEYKIDEKTGAVLTAHTTNPVPVLICGSTIKRLRSNGGLSDIAPTVLEIMGLSASQEMTGYSLSSD